MAIQHRMNGAFGRNLDIGKSANQALSNLTSSPGGVLALHVQDIVFNLKRKLLAIAIRSSAPVGQSLNAAFLVAIKNFVACLAGDPKLPAKFRYRLACS